MSFLGASLQEGVLLGLHTPISYHAYKKILRVPTYVADATACLLVAINALIHAVALVKLFSVKQATRCW